MLLRPRGILSRQTIARISFFKGKRGRPTGPQVTGPEPIAAPRRSTAAEAPQQQGPDRRP
jgi:hypothetical protein